MQYRIPDDFEDENMMRNIRLTDSLPIIMANAKRSSRAKVASEFASRPGLYSTGFRKRPIFNPLLKYAHLMVHIFDRCLAEATATDKNGKWLAHGTSKMIAPKGLQTIGDALRFTGSEEFPSEIYLTRSEQAECIPANYPLFCRLPTRCRIFFTSFSTSAVNAPRMSAFCERFQIITMVSTLTVTTVKPTRKLIYCTLRLYQPPTRCHTIFQYFRVF